LAERIGIKEFVPNYLDQIVVLLQSVNHNFRLGQVSDGFAHFLHDLERVSFNNLLDQNVDGILPLGNELIEHLDILILELLPLLLV